MTSLEDTTIRQFFGFGDGGDAARRRARRVEPRPARLVHHDAAPASWSALPERDDAADRALAENPAIAPRAATADVFYVHPTSYVGARWNGPVDDAELAAATAPSHSPTTTSDAPSTRSSRAAGPSGPSCSRGTAKGPSLLERLLLEVVGPSPLRERLVAAYLVGGLVTVETLRTRAPNVPPCRAADDVGCVVAWTARSPSFRPTPFELAARDPGERVCTNPLHWRADGSPGPRELHRGAVFFEANDVAPRLGFADARCEGGTLVVSSIGEAPRDLPSRLLDRVMGTGN